MKTLCALLVALFIASNAHAQIATTTSKIVLDQDASSPAAAQALVYKHYDDNATTGTVLSGVTCVATNVPTTQTCSASVPAFTPTGHTLVLTASNAAGESLPSTVLSFTFVVVPNPPKSPRIVP